MPKATKLHSKGKSSSIQKSTGTSEGNDGKSDPEETARQFQLELCWCIQRLERSLTEKKENEKKLQEAWKVLQVLKNNNQPIIRKRQLMRTHFGDYRAKMAAEEKKLATMASKMKISEVSNQPKAKFVRKSAFLTTGDDSFRFNFHLSPEQKDDSSSGSAVACEMNNEEPSNNKTEDTTFKFTFSSSDFKFNFNSENS